ncbi:MAG: type II toxin-antitoxin system VapC family toxin [Deltaproteobacteria bacterium]|nr:type II toxin-antitoxin system VapC family toxin [Deltaproteobacteria bacterium]
MTIGYIDTSVVLRFIFGEKSAFRRWELVGQIYSSSILHVEALRTIDRLRLQGKLSDNEVARRTKALYEFQTSIHEIGISPSILGRASQSYPTIIRTLDAIHLATAMILREEKKLSPFFITHDTQQKIAADALGFETLDI